jgi:MFS family permease
MPNPFVEIIGGFRKVEKHIISLIIAVLFIQLVDAAFFMLFNYYLRKLSYSDSEIASITAFRYVAIMVLAFPLGVYIKGRRLMPFFRISSIALPIVSFLVIYAVEYRFQAGIMIGMILYGVLRLMLQVCAMPFIVLNAKKETHSEAISLYFQTFSISVFASGLINYVLAGLAPDFFTEKLMLQIFALTALIGSFFVFSIKIEEPLSEKVPLRNIFHSYDWGLIMNALIPTIMIAVGAGFTIPFINLFFQSVHGVDSRDFSIIGSLSFVLVAIMLIFIPFIQRHYGYRTAIVTFQGLAILALFVMASTEWYNQYSFALPIAITAYLLRQPLMNVAGPSTSELSLNYVGERNQEILSALQAAVWSGSWFISSLLFGWMRDLEISYVNIFMITVLLYIIATAWYLRLISAFETFKKR